MRIFYMEMQPIMQTTNYKFWGIITAKMKSNKSMQPMYKLWSYHYQDTNIYIINMCLLNNLTTFYKEISNIFLCSKLKNPLKQREKGSNENNNTIPELFYKLTNNINARNRSTQNHFQLTNDAPQSSPPASSLTRTPHCLSLQHKVAMPFSCHFQLW